MVILKEPLKSKAIQGHLLQNSDANLEHFGTLTSFCREMKRWICVSLSYSVIYNINLKKSNMYMHPRLIRMSFNDFFLMNFRFLALFFLKIVKKNHQDACNFLPVGSKNLYYILHDLQK